MTSRLPSRRRRNPDEPVRPDSRLFDPAPAVDADAADPAALARAATLASGRAMRDQQWAEAKALAALAEGYARLGQRAHGAGQTIATMDLKLLFDVLTDDGGATMARMALDPDRMDDPDRALKEDYHQQMSAACLVKAHRQMALLRRIHAAEGQVRAAGGAVAVSQSGFEATVQTRDWLMAVATELDDVTVTPSPPPGDPWKIGM